MTEVLKSNKSKDREASESKLLEAAKCVFSQYGFNGATTRMIAQKSGVNISLINRYFDGKYGLLLAMLKQQNTAFRELALSYPPCETAVEEICKFADHVFEVYFVDPQFVKIVMGQFCTDEKFLADFRSMFPTDEAHPMLLERLEILKAKNKIHPETLIHQVTIDLESAIFGMNISNVIVGGYETEVAMLKTKSFLTGYARSLL